MQRKEEQLLNTMDRSEEFLQSNGDRMTSVITSAGHQNLADSRLRLDGFRTAQGTCNRMLLSHTATARALRTRLIVEHLRPIAAVAVAQLDQVGELSAFIVPLRDLRYGALVGVGQSMAEAAKVHEAALIAGGLPVDFIARLVAATEALRESLSARGQTLALRVEATAGLLKEAATARNALRVIDSMVRAAARNDDLLLDRWMSIRHVVATGSSPRESGDPIGSTEGSAPQGGITRDAEVRAAA